MYCDAIDVCLERVLVADRFCVSRAVACGIDRLHGEWLVLMCCVLGVSNGCL